MKISVGIPTIAGRTKYLAAALKTCVTQDDDDFEIIVSDNSPGDAREVVEGFRDPRIRYVRPDDYLPMSAHWDFMVSHFTGDMVTIIGDDDGLMPGALRRVRELVAQYGERPIQHALANYCWPDFPAEDRNRFWFMHPPGRATTIRSSAAYLDDLCRAKARYIEGPMIYHNFIPGAVLRRLAIGGSVFHRSSPDVYSAITIAAHTDSFVSTQEVLTFAGQGARANGAAVRDGGADGQRFIREMQQARYAPRYDSLTVQLHTVDSILEASERYALPQLAQAIAFGEHFCIAANECLDMPKRSRGLRQLGHVVREAAKAGVLPYLLRDRGGRLLQIAAGKLTGRGRNVAPRNESDFTPGDRHPVPSDVTDIYSATLHLHQLLARHGMA
ncbi:MAG: pglI 3 [Ramlibacter sp.]|nr:pglI 3 [Ramlibacter sp.]